MVTGGESRCRLRSRHRAETGFPVCVYQPRQCASAAASLARAGRLYRRDVSGKAGRYARRRDPHGGRRYRSGQAVRDPPWPRFGLTPSHTEYGRSTTTQSGVDPVADRNGADRHVCRGRCVGRSRVGSIDCLRVRSQLGAHDVGHHVRLERRSPPTAGAILRHTSRLRRPDACTTFWACVGTGEPCAVYLWCVNPALLRSQPAARETMIEHTKDAETGHLFILLVITGITVWALASGWWVRRAGCCCSIFSTTDIPSCR